MMNSLDAYDRLEGLSLSEILALVEQAPPDKWGEIDMPNQLVEQ